jgi:hypothetical protein
MHRLPCAGLSDRDATIRTKALQVAAEVAPGFWKSEGQDGRSSLLLQIVRIIASRCV